MRLRLGDLARDEGIGARRDRRLEVALRAARAPGDVVDGLLRGSGLDHSPPQNLLHVRRQCGGIGESVAACTRAHKAQILFAEAPAGGEPQLQPQLRVVAEFGVSIQRQVVGKEVDVVCQQQGQAQPAASGTPSAMPAAASAATPAATPSATDAAGAQASEAPSESASASDAETEAEPEVLLDTRGIIPIEDLDKLEGTELPPESEEPTAPAPADEGDQTERP
jgi:hypothetical protein